MTLTGIYQRIRATMACLWKSYVSNLDKPKVSVSLRVRGPIRIWILTVSPLSSRLGPLPSATPQPTLHNTPLPRGLCWEFGILKKAQRKRFSDHWSVFKGNNGTLTPSFPLQTPHSHSPSFPLCLLARTTDFFDQAFLQRSKMKRPFVSCQVCQVFCHSRMQLAQIPPHIRCPNTTAPLGEQTPRPWRPLTLDGLTEEIHHSLAGWPKRWETVNSTGPKLGGGIHQRKTHFKGLRNHISNAFPWINDTSLKLMKTSAEIFIQSTW